MNLRWSLIIHLFFTKYQRPSSLIFLQHPTDHSRIGLQFMATVAHYRMSTEVITPLMHWSALCISLTSSEPATVYFNGEKAEVSSILLWEPSASKFENLTFWERKYQRLLYYPSSAFSSFLFYGSLWNDTIYAFVCLFFKNFCKLISLLSLSAASTPGQCLREHPFSQNIIFCIWCDPPLFSKL